MKNKFIKIMGILFLTGIILCGIGCGIFAAEIYNFDYVKEDVNSTEPKTKEFVFNLPDNQPLYYKNLSGDYTDCKSFKVTSDSTVEKGCIKYVVSYVGGYFDFSVYTTNEYYIYDRANKYISEHNIYYLDELGYSYDGIRYGSNDYTDFKKFMNNFKNRKFVEYVDNSEYSIEIRVNPLDSGRLIALNSQQIITTYEDYLNMYDNSKESEKIEVYRTE